LASWWGAAHARAGAVTPSQIVRAAAGDHSPAGTVVSAAFAACAARDSAIPPSLEGLADRLDTLQEDGRNFARGRNSDQPRFLWQKALSGGARSIHRCHVLSPVHFYWAPSYACIWWYSACSGREEAWPLSCAQLAWS